MTYKPSGKKITSVCDDCKQLLREADAVYATWFKPSKRLCRACFSKEIDIDLTGVKL